MSNVNLYGIGSSGVSLGPSCAIPVIHRRAPTSADVNGPSGKFQIGQVWINTATSTPYQLVNLTTSNGIVSATWFTDQGGTNITFNADSGSAVPSGGALAVVGGTGIVTSATAS